MPVAETRSKPSTVRLTCSATDAPVSASMCGSHISRASRPPPAERARRRSGAPIPRSPRARRCPAVAQRQRSEGAAVETRRLGIAGADVGHAVVLDAPAQGVHSKRERRFRPRTGGTRRRDDAADQDRMDRWSSWTTAGSHAERVRNLSGHVVAHRGERGGPQYSPVTRTRRCCIALACPVVTASGRGTGAGTPRRPQQKVRSHATFPPPSRGRRLLPTPETMPAPLFVARAFAF